MECSRYELSLKSSQRFTGDGRCGYGAEFRGFPSGVCRAGGLSIGRLTCVGEGGSGTYDDTSSSESVARRQCMRLVIGREVSKLSSQGEKSSRRRSNQEQEQK